MPGYTGDGTSCAEIIDKCKQESDALTRLAEVEAQAAGLKYKSAQLTDMESKMKAQYQDTLAAVAKSVTSHELYLASEARNAEMESQFWIVNALVVVVTLLICIVMYELKTKYTAAAAHDEHVAVLVAQIEAAQPPFIEA